MDFLRSSESLTVTSMGEGVDTFADATIFSGTPRGSLNSRLSFPPPQVWGCPRNRVNSTESVSLGVKGRWVDFDSFSDGVVWDPLRSHGPNLRRDGSEPVSGRIKTNDIEMFGVSVNLKYRF